MAWGPITVEGRPAAAGEKFINADIRVVAADYFKAMNIPLLKGRLFSEQDTRATPRVVVVDEHMASQLWPGSDPIGKRIRTGGFDAAPDTPWMTVVGVVGRVKQDALDADSRMAYYRYQGQSPSRAMNVVVRTAGSPSALAPDVTPRDPRHRSGPPDLQDADDGRARRRVAGRAAVLDAAADLLRRRSRSASPRSGIYGVMAYLVARARASSAFASRSALRRAACCCSWFGRA